LTTTQLHSLCGATCYRRCRWQMVRESTAASSPVYRDCCRQGRGIRLLWRHQWRQRRRHGIPVLLSAGTRKRHLRTANSHVIATDDAIEIQTCR